MEFLTARWENLILANYQVEPEILKPFVPAGTQIDLFKGTAFLSLVAFQFNRTIVCGIRFPGHTNFAEVNLRFYIVPNNDLGKRSVTFIKEIVPKKQIVAVANGLFQENYQYMPVEPTHNLERQNRTGTFGHRWGNRLLNQWSVTQKKDLVIPHSDSLECFITEHYFGYASGKKGTVEYEVKHPQWACGEIDKYEIDVDFGNCYGNEFGFLSTTKPECVLFAAGSEVSVSWPKRHEVK